MGSFGFIYQYLVDSSQHYLFLVWYAVFCDQKMLHIEHVCPHDVTGSPCTFFSVFVKLLLSLGRDPRLVRGLCSRALSALELLSRCLCESSKPVMEYTNYVFLV